MVEARPVQSPLEHIAAFRGVYIGIFAYIVLAVMLLDGAERVLTAHFQGVVETATRVSPSAGRVVPLIQDRLSAGIVQSRWTRLMGVRVNAIVLGADAQTPIYLNGRTLAPPPQIDPGGAMREAMRLLPALSSAEVAVPFDSLLAGCIWVGLGAIIVPLLFLQQRRLARREEALFESALATRDATLERARTIQGELDKVQQRLARLEPVERAHSDEIRKLQDERSELHGRLRALSEREDNLRATTLTADDLERERTALESLLDEAAQDLEVKEREITDLQERLQTAARSGGSSRGRTRAAEQLGKRMRTLYPSLEFDARAIGDIVGLGDETLRLRAEEALKRLESDQDNATVRRKVGGLPAQLSIFELGFAGKGRIYYTKAKSQGFRVLAVGGKASQKTDLDYLSKLDLK
ncbi:MAG: hypothetical protein JRH16_16170 [Deltaproteobacteria bacterium]|nr:hypothetical protein [Deltaproteobacteria bacterium]